MIIYILFWILGYAYSDKCYNKSSNGVTEAWFCCDNHEEKNGTCVECDIGYVSKDGLPCIPCLAGSWGVKCGFTCSCQHHQRCDIVHGCVGATTVMTGSVENGKCYNKLSNAGTESWFCCNNHENRNGVCVECEIGYVSKDGFPCMACLRGRWGRKCGYTCSCQQNERCDIVSGCVDGSIDMSGRKPRKPIFSSTTTKSISSTDINGGLLSIIYSMGAGSIVVMVAFAICCLKYKRKAEYFYNSRSPRIHNEKATTEPESVSRNNESGYAVINENTMVDNHTSIVPSNEHLHQAVINYPASHDLDCISCSFSFSNENELKLSDEGYLKSVDPIMIEDEIYGYETLPNETVKNCGISSGNSGSIINAADQIYSNINSYQQIIPFGDMHRYTPLDEEEPKHQRDEQCISDFETDDLIFNIENAEQISTLLRKGIPMKVKSKDV